jgi:hypothetical protein
MQAVGSLKVRRGEDSVLRLCGFPNPVNEKAARVVAAGVAVLGIVTIAADVPWLLIPLVYGFLARVLTGPKLSPLGLLATKVVAPRLGPPKLVPGPPKRFAQGMGLAFSSVALVLWFGFGEHAAAVVFTGMLCAAALLESVFALCLGCRVFALLARIGLIPEAVCESCADLGLRLR